MLVLSHEIELLVDWSVHKAVPEAAIWEDWCVAIYSVVFVCSVRMYRQLDVEDHHSGIYRTLSHRQLLSLESGFEGPAGFRLPSVCIRG
jgi:hypothetical protein